MAIKNSSTNWETRKCARMCGCPTQDNITPMDIQNLIKDAKYHLRNLPHTFAAEIEGKTPYAIREMLLEARVPFRWQGCPRGDMLCCGSCTRVCDKRCPQDVFCRAYLICGNIIDAPEGQRAQRYAESCLTAQMLYDEMTSELPRYFAIVAMVNEYTSPIYNKQLERIILNEYEGKDSPCKCDYAPQFEYEESEKGIRKKVDPESGEASVLNWPLSGMCPFCLPTGMVDRRRRARGTYVYK